jgi:hypothetical protein
VLYQRLAYYNMQWYAGSPEEGRAALLPGGGCGSRGEPVHQSVAEGGTHRWIGHLGEPEGSGGWGRTGPGGCGGGRTGSMPPAVALLGVECRPMEQRI